MGNEMVEIQQDEEDQKDDEDEIDSNTPLQRKQNDPNMNNNKVPTIYNEYMRRGSISTSDIPHSLQVVTPQHLNRPKDDVLSQIHDMGFDLNLAEMAYKKL